MSGASSAGPRKRLGIFGGTFDPVHNGHLWLAKAALREFGLAQVVFLPSRCPPHKAAGTVASFEHRTAMLGMALARLKGVLLCPMESDESCPTYVGDSISAVKAAYGGGWDFYFIAGIDVIGDLAGGRAARITPGLVKFIAADRPGWDRSAALKAVPPASAKRIAFVGGMGPDVSSSAIRRRLAGGLPVEDLLPAAVERHIRENGLYRVVAS